MKKIIHYIITALSFLNLIIFMSARPIWFFINQEAGGSSLVSYSIFGIIIVLFLLNILLLFKVKNFKFKHILLAIPTLIFMGLNVYLIYMMGSEKNTIVRNLLPMIPVFIIIILLAILVQKKYKLNIWVKAILALAVFFIVLFPQLNLQRIKITSGPNLTYVNDELVVIWTTNVKSTGFAEVQTKDGIKRYVSSENGIIDGNTMHFKVSIPDIEDGDIIRVAGKKIKAYYQNNVVYGKTVYSDELIYNDTRENSEVSFYVLSDIHERKDVYDKYLKNDDYDFVIFNGDLLSSVDDEKLIISEFLEPITDIEVPFYFSRGNHETRGADSRVLDDYLALEDNRYYYTFTYGSIYFIVLDSAEDKEDSHIEYAGLADFESYRNEETQWLESVVNGKEYEDYEYVIAVCHIPLTEDEKFPYKEEWMYLLSQMSADVLISGHTHKAEFIETERVPIIIGGGYTEANSGYEALKVSAGKQLIIDIITEDGTVRESYSID